jgi:hypothetical protein
VSSRVKKVIFFLEVLGKSDGRSTCSRLREIEAGIAGCLACVFFLDMAGKMQGRDGAGTGFAY